MCRNHYNPESGFSIIEVLVVVAIAMILAAIAIPSFNLFIGNTRTSTITNEFVAALNLARSEAMKRGVNVTVCRSTNGTACAASGDWGQGWMVYVMDGATLVPLRVREGLKNSNSFVGVGHFATDNAVANFQPDGRMGTTINESNDGFQVSNMGKAMCIRLNTAGRVRTDRGSCS
jgi:type IV fimbrial biogenesis protein FimT